ncbi:hypothetical protein V6Z11_D05G393800 [Gossypium hirsutum]
MEPFRFLFDAEGLLNTDPTPNLVKGEPNPTKRGVTVRLLFLRRGAKR